MTFSKFGHVKRILLALLSSNFGSCFCFTFLSFFLLLLLFLFFIFFIFFLFLNLGMWILTRHRICGGGHEQFGALIWDGGSSPAPLTSYMQERGKKRKGN
ncbi:hypothetical protein NMG60_11029561 [Bertholletia excelsa]